MLYILVIEFDKLFFVYLIFRFEWEVYGEDGLYIFSFFSRSV